LTVSSATDLVIPSTACLLPTYTEAPAARVGSLWIEGTGVLKKKWADGSLNKIKRVYLDPLEIEPATSP
jgi:hypothetical protein